MSKKNKLRTRQNAHAHALKRATQPGASSTLLSLTLAVHSSSCRAVVCLCGGRFVVLMCATMFGVAAPEAPCHIAERDR